MTGANKETDFETLAINIPGIIYRVYLREPKRMVLFNDMLQQMTGYEAAELKVGQVCSIDPIIISEDYSDVMRIVEEAVRENKSFEVVYRIKHKDGSLRYFLERGSPIYGDDKQPEFIDGVILDVTDHKQKDEALRESEEKFRSLVETTSDWIWEVDANGIYTYVSPRVRDLLGYEPEEVLGREVFEFMPPSKSARIREEFFKSARKREPLVAIENVNIRKDGRRVVLETSGVPKLDAMGNLLGYRGIDRDITQRKSAEKELRDKDVKLRELAQRLNYHIENSPMAVIEWGPDMRLIRWAGKAEPIFGWRADEVLGKRMEEFPWIYKEDEVQVAQVSAELQSGADPQRFSANRNYRKDGSVIHCEWYNSSLVDDSGRLQSILSRVLDVTERKRLEEALRKANDELEIRVQERTSDLEESNKVLERYAAKLERLNDEMHYFVFAASHDLQEPLRKIQTFCDLAMKKCNSPLDCKGKEYMDRVINTSGRMRQLLRDLLQFSRMTTKPESLREINLGETAGLAANFFEEDLKESGGLVEIEGIPIIEAAEDQMLQLFQNLIGNALKFCGAESPRIQIRAMKDGEQYEILIKDNGIGFDTQFSERIFMPFQRLHSRKEYEGTGMGLAVCRKIVEWHGGSIRAESELGKGSTFMIRLPVKHETEKGL